MESDSLRVGTPAEGLDPSFAASDISLLKTKRKHSSSGFVSTNPEKLDTEFAEVRHRERGEARAGVGKWQNGTHPLV
jgi:hypothetical protein